MNHATRFAKLALLLALVGALALGGCGGDNGLSAADQARIDQAEADKVAADKAAADAKAAADKAAADLKAAEDKAAADKVAADKAAADAKAAADKAAADLKAAEDKAAADKVAADKAAADAKAAADKAAADLKAAEDKAAADEAERQRMANIAAARMTLSDEEDALAALADDATDEARRDAQRMVEAAANTLRDVLRMNGGPTADIDAATGKAVTAKNAADALQAMITARADAATAAQMEAINTAQMALSDEEAALMALAEDATDEAKRDAQRAVQDAAAALVQALMGNGGTDDQIAAAEMKQASAEMMADDLEATITAAADAAAAAQMLADQRSAIAGAVMTARTAVNAVNNDSTDDEISAAEMAIAAVTAAIGAATDVPDSEKAANTTTVVALTAQLAGAKATRMAAMDEAARQQAEAQRMEAIATANADFETAKAALAELPGDATDEDKLVAQRLVEAAANILRDVLRMNGGSTADINAAIEASVRAELAADNLQATITAAANAAAAARTAAINSAQTALNEAGEALAALADDATDEQRRDAYRVVENAAAHLAQVLTDNEGTADQIATVIAMRDSAKTGADALHMKITAAADAAAAAQMLADQRKAIADAIMAAQVAVNAVNNDATDDEISAADATITEVTAAIAAATDVPDLEKAANTATVNALMVQLGGAKASRMTAMDAAAQAQRVAAINTAKDYLAEKEIALAALPDNATDEQKRDAQRMVEAAANNLRDVLQMNDGLAADIEAAVRKAQTAKVTADALQATITAAAGVAEQLRMAAINTAQMDLDDAETALMALADDATDKEERDAHRAVERAAEALVTVLEDNEGTDGQIAAAKMKRDSAKMMADDLTPEVDIVDQRMAITSALAAAATAVAAVDDDATDAEVMAADDAIAVLEKAIADATDLPETEIAPWKVVLTSHEDSLAANKSSRQMAMDEAAEEDRNQQRIADNAAGLLVADAIVRDTNGHDATTVSVSGNLPGTLHSLTTTHEDGTITLRRSTGVKLTAMNTMSPGDDWTAKRFAFDETMGAVFTNWGEPEVMVESYSYDVFFRSGGIGAMEGTIDLDSTGTLTIIAGTFPSANFNFVGFPAAVKGAGEFAQTFPSTFKVKGSYHGVSGEFECDLCVLAREINSDDEDMVTVSGAVLLFTPTIPTGQTTADINLDYTTRTPDADYYRFGYWMVTSGAGANLKQTIRTFADQTGYGIPPLLPNTLVGKATYSGAAAGIYVHKVGAGDSLVVSDGEFVADAALAAQFLNLDGTVAEVDQQTVTGTISGFRPAMGDDDLTAWTLMLEKVDLDVTTFADPLPLVGATSGGGDKGVWSVHFHGIVDTAQDSASIDAHPTAAIGQFNGHFANGHVAGAFGAEKD